MMSGSSKPPPPEDRSTQKEPNPPGASEARTVPLRGFERPPERIGVYKILETIGEGGMGTVYLTEQTEPVHRRVALKVIKLGMDSKEVIGRFEAERQALALMDHPNIAKVFDAGLTPEGRPFFAMEHVQGVPITDYCDRHRLSNEERLRLFIPVCQAIQHAHQKAIIHRDIKATNILVSSQEDKPVPKVIDFGVAKATGHKLTERTVFTEQGMLIGTPEYMSPEQAEMTGLNVDTRTDVYSLGVLLYELLTGALPFDPRALRESGLEGIQKKIREEEPPRPSTRVSTLGEQATQIALHRKTVPGMLAKQIRGELDWITMRAMEKDRTRRYQSALELGADICRYLSHEPVLAGPPSTAYRVRKFVRRNRVGVGFAGMVLLMVLALAGTMTVQAARIARERDRANLEAETAQEVSDFLVDLFGVSDPGEARGNTITAREILDKGAERIESSLRDQPLFQARMMDTMGRVYQNLGLFDDSRQLFEQALGVREGELGTSHPDVARNLSHLGWLKYRQGKNEESLSLIKRALSIQEKVLGQDHIDAAWSRYYSGLPLNFAGKSDSGIVALNRAMEVFERELGGQDLAVAWCLNDLGLIYQLKGDYETAVAYSERALEIKETVLPPDHIDLVISLCTLGYNLTLLGEYERARSLLERAVQTNETILEPTNPVMGVALHSLGELYRRSGDYSEAQQTLDRSRQILESTLEWDHPSLAEVIHSLALLAQGTGRLVEADTLHARCLRLRESASGRTSPQIVECLEDYASLLRSTGRVGRASELEARVRAIRERQSESGLSN